MATHKLKEYKFDIRLEGKATVKIIAPTSNKAAELIQKLWKAEITTLIPPETDIREIKLPIELKIKQIKFYKNAKVTIL